MFSTRLPAVGRRAFVRARRKCCPWKLKGSLDLCLNLLIALALSPLHSNQSALSSTGQLFWPVFKWNAHTEKQTQRAQTKQTRARAVRAQISLAGRRLSRSIHLKLELKSVSQLESDGQLVVVQTRCSLFD